MSRLFLFFAGSRRHRDRSLWEHTRQPEDQPLRDPRRSVPTRGGEQLADPDRPSRSQQIRLLPLDTKTMWSSVDSSDSSCYNNYLSCFEEARILYPLGDEALTMLAMFRPPHPLLARSNTCYPFIPTTNSMSSFWIGNLEDLHDSIACCYRNCFILRLLHHFLTEDNWHTDDDTTSASICDPLQFRYKSSVNASPEFGCNYFPWSLQKKLCSFNFSYWLTFQVSLAKRVKNLKIIMCLNIVFDTFGWKLAGARPIEQRETVGTCTAKFKCENLGIHPKACFDTLYCTTLILSWECQLSVKNLRSVKIPTVNIIAWSFHFTTSLSSSYSTNI